MLRWHITGGDLNCCKQWKKTREAARFGSVSPRLSSMQIGFCDVKHRRTLLFVFDVIVVTLTCHCKQKIKDTRCLETKCTVYSVQIQQFRRLRGPINITIFEWNRPRRGWVIGDSISFTGLHIFQGASKQTMILKAE